MIVGENDCRNNNRRVHIVHGGDLMSKELVEQKKDIFNYQFINCKIHQPGRQNLKITIVKHVTITKK